MQILKREQQRSERSTSSRDSSPRTRRGWPHTFTATTSGGRKTNTSCGRNYEWIEKSSSSTFQFPQRHGQPLVEHQSRVSRKLHRLLRRGLCLLSQATKPILDTKVGSGQAPMKYSSTSSHPFSGTSSNIHTNIKTFIEIVIQIFEYTNIHRNIHKSSHPFSGTPSALAWLPSRSLMPCRWLMALDGQSGRNIRTWDNHLVNDRL